MINLIPEEIKKKLKKSFFIKIIILLFFTLSLAIFIVNLFFVPFFMFSLSQKKLANQELNREINSPQANYDEGVQELIEDIDLKLKMIEESKTSKFNVSIVLDKILSQKIDGIKINSIDYRDDNTKGRFFNIKGYASSRETLLSFKNILERDKNFKNIDLPISNFIQKTNIQFNLLLVPI